MGDIQSMLITLYGVLFILMGLSLLVVALELHNLRKMIERRE